MCSVRSRNDGQCSRALLQVLPLEYYSKNILRTVGVHGEKQLMHAEHFIPSAIQCCTLCTLRALYRAKRFSVKISWHRSNLVLTSREGNENFFLSFFLWAKKLLSLKTLSMDLIWKKSILTEVRWTSWQILKFLTQFYTFKKCSASSAFFVYDFLFLLPLYKKHSRFIWKYLCCLMFMPFNVVSFAKLSESPSEFERKTFAGQI